MVATCLIFAGGVQPPRRILEAVSKLTDADLIIAADSGLHFVEKLGVKIDAVVGDMDSVSSSSLAIAEKLGAKVIRHPTNKDFTDTHAALLFAHRAGAKRVVVVTAGGGRLDHQLGIFAAMFDPQLAAVQIEAIHNETHVYALQSNASCHFDSQIGDLVGLQAFSSTVFGITTSGLQWNLTDDQLENFSTRGVSNKATGSNVVVKIGIGQLMVTHQKEN